MKIHARLYPIAYLGIHITGSYDLILYVGRFKTGPVEVKWGRGICRGYKGVYGPSTFAGCKRAAKNWGKA